MPRFPRSPFVDLFKIFGIVVFGGAALAPAAAAQDVLVKEIDETFDWTPANSRMRRLWNCRSLP
jgi:hypothetical protein